jgi:acetylserotonin N-methyltransferase
MSRLFWYRRDTSVIQDTPIGDDKPIWDLWLSCMWLPAITAARATGIFSALAENASDADTLAAKHKLNARAVRTELSMLAALGLLVQRDGRYSITETTRHYLLEESPYSWGGLLSIWQERLPYHDALVALLRGEQVVRPDAKSENRKPSDAWADGKVGASMAQRIACFMHAHSATAAVGAARNGDWKGVRRLLDVGGGSGVFANAIAGRHPHIHCTVMDLPAMCDAAQEYINAAGMNGSVDTVAVDMFRQPWPQGYDALFFSNVFHDWSPATCLDLARKAYEVLPAGGRIVLHEILLDDHGDGPRTAAAFSLLMLLGTEGQQFTFAGLREILAGAGFTNITATATHSYYSLVQGFKP